jgi:4-hydroxythreonine-4-phosphate dehydrogenase
MPLSAASAPLAVSSGDPAGVGPEIIGKAWAARHESSLPPFFAVGDANSFAAHWDGPIVRIDSADQALERFDDALPVFQIHECESIIPGQPDLDGAHCALQALEMATGFARSGSASGVVTGPVSKTQLYAIGFTHPGQTEFVAERCGIAKNNAVMMLAGPDLRVVPACSMRVWCGSASGRQRKACNAISVSQSPGWRWPVSTPTRAKMATWAGRKSTYSAPHWNRYAKKAMM